MIIKGDISGDGKLDGRDARIIQAILLTSVFPEGETFIAADVNNDNQITLGDLAKINKHLLGIKIINEVIY